MTQRERDRLVVLKKAPKKLIPQEQAGKERNVIARHEEANWFLREEYLEDHNAVCAGAGHEPQDYHRKAPSARVGASVLSETERSISNDWVAGYENRYFQLERQVDYPPRQKPR